jgi:hypothetical protein
LVLVVIAVSQLLFLVPFLHHFKLPISPELDFPIVQKEVAVLEQSNISSF